MNEKAQNFLNDKRGIEKRKQEAEKQKVLIELGLYEKVYSPDNISNEEFSFYEWDSTAQTSKYYKKVPIDVTDEDYQEIKKYAKQEEKTSDNNPIATALTVIAWIVFIVGFIAGMTFGNIEVVKGSYYMYTDTEFSFAIAFTYWGTAFISGTLLLGFAEIIKLLDAIKKK